MMKNRRQTNNDFRLSAIIGFGTVLSIIAFFTVFYSMMAAEGIQKILGIIVFGGILFSLFYALKKKDSEKSGQIFTIFASAFALILPALFSLSGIFAGFPVIALNFIIVKPVRAAVLNGIIVLLIGLLYGGGVSGLLVQIVYIISSAALIAILFVFSVYTDDQSSQNAKFKKQRLMLNRLATHDPLTGIGNRRTMEERVSASVETFACNGVGQSVAILDLDHFKLVNDMFGHDEGDRVLISFSKLVLDMLREGDELFRFGGEEFVALLSGSDTERVQPMMEEIRMKVAENINAQGRPVTTSIGVAYLNPGEDWDDWIKRADLALYKAKACGRNQVVMASPPEISI